MVGEFGRLPDFAFRYLQVLLGFLRVAAKIEFVSLLCVDNLGPRVMAQLLGLQQIRMPWALSNSHPGNEQQQSRNRGEYTGFCHRGDSTSPSA